MRFQLENVHVTSYVSNQWKIQAPTIVFMDLICLYLFKCNLELVCKTIKSNKPNKNNLLFDTNQDVSIINWYNRLQQIR